jgi:hypothetical protein
LINFYLFDIIYALIFSSQSLRCFSRPLAYHRQTLNSFSHSPDYHRQPPDYFSHSSACFSRSLNYSRHCPDYFSHPPAYHRKPSKNNCGTNICSGQRKKEPPFYLPPDSVDEGAGLVDEVRKWKRKKK